MGRQQHSPGRVRKDDAGAYGSRRDLEPAGVGRTAHRWRRSRVGRHVRRVLHLGVTPRQVVIHSGGWCAFGAGLLDAGSTLRGSRILRDREKFRAPGVVR